MKIVVAGGYGFVGANLVKLLGKKGHKAIALSRRDGFDLTNIDLVVEFLAKHRPQVIYNCAAHVGSVHYVMKNAGQVLSDNLRMAVNLYRAVATTDPSIRVVNPLSNCSYPGDANIHYEPDWLKGEPHHSVYAYAHSKRSIYILARCHAEQFGVRSVNFLVPNTFGVGDHVDTNRTHALSGMICRMIAAERAGETRFEVWGSGRPVREWAFIDDITEIMSKAVEMNDGLLDPVNIAQNSGVSIRESAYAIAAAIGYRGEIWFNTNYEDGAPIKVLDDRRFRSIFPDYRFIDHSEAIRRTVTYYREVLSASTPMGMQRVT